MHAFRTWLSAEAESSFEHLRQRFVDKFKGKGSKKRAGDCRHFAEMAFDSCRASREQIWSLFAGWNLSIWVYIFAGWRSFSSLSELTPKPDETRWLFHLSRNAQSVSRSRRCLVAYLARSMDRRCTQPDWDAAIEQSSVLFLWLLSDKRGAGDQPETAPDRGTDQQNRRSDPLQSWSSTPLQVKSVCAGIFQIFVVC